MMFNTFYLLLKFYFYLFYSVTFQMKHCKFMGIIFKDESNPKLCICIFYQVNGNSNHLVSFLTKSHF